MVPTRFVSGAVAAVALCASSAFAGPDWLEGAIDAGSLVGSAQRVTGIGQLNVIQGSLSAGGFGDRSAPDYEDLFIIEITEPTTLSFTTTAAGFNPQLFLFSLRLDDAYGVLANNDTPAGILPVITNPATDGTGSAVVVPGTYALGVSGLGRYPVSNGGAIFFFGSSTEVSGPDGPGGADPLTGWAGVGQTGDYSVTVESVGFVDVPAPGSAGLLLGLGALAARRRR